MKAATQRSRSEESWFLLEKPAVFSESLLWSLQRQYFDRMGVEAWRRGEVPHYVSSNPTVANSYAETVFAFLRDRQRLAAEGTARDPPLTLCELGAGSGRLAFHFLKRLTGLCERAGLAPTGFRYLLTDVAEATLEFWRRHPRFQPFFDSGLLDIAAFDVLHSKTLTLRLSGQTIAAGSLTQPLVVIANYVFDSLPQELFYIDDGCLRRCLVSLFVDEDPAALDVVEILARLRCRYEYQTLGEPPYEEPGLQSLLADYRHTLADTHLLFPAPALRCLQRLKELSTQGLLVLTADKGEHRLAGLQGRRPPGLARHGSVSLDFNYHALRAFCERAGGLALFPVRRANSVNIGCLLMLGEPADYRETQSAWHRHVVDFGPDDFYTIAKHAQCTVGEMSVADILAYLRLGHYDGHQFLRYLPRLTALASGWDAAAREAVREAVEMVWDLYFPLGEERDLAHGIGGLLYEMDDYALALAYFERSMELYGQDTGTLTNMAACHHLLGRNEPAARLLRKVLRYDPDNQQARALLAACENALAPGEGGGV